jgi:tetratricopeptide (TPR) repeat protein
MHSIVEDLRLSAPTAASAIEYLCVPRRFTRQEAIRLLTEHVTPNGYNPAVLDLLKTTGTLRSLDGYLAITDQTRLSVLASLPQERLTAAAVVWQHEVDKRPDDQYKTVEAAYLGLLAAQEKGALRLRHEFGTAEAANEPERLAFVARLAREGAPQYANLSRYAQAAMYYVLGMHEYRQRQIPRAMTHFQQVVETGVRNQDMAIAQHLLANYWSRKRSRWSDAENLYKDSIQIGRDIGNQYHVAQVEHSFANLLSRQRPRWSDAENLYEDSIQIGRDIGDKFSVAQVEHSFANLLSRQRPRWSDAENLYKDSIQNDLSLGNQSGVAQSMHSYANLLARQRPRWGDAENLYADSLQIGREIGNLFHVAQVSFKYGEFLCANSIDTPRGLELLKDSLDLNIQMQTRFVTQVRDTYWLYSS